MKSTAKFERRNNLLILQKLVEIEGERERERTAFEISANDSNWLF